MRAAYWLRKGKFSKKKNFVFITHINLRTSSTTTFIVHNRSFAFFIGYENECFLEQRPFVLLTEINSWKDIRLRQLQNLLSLLSTTVASNETHLGRYSIVESNAMSVDTPYSTEYPTIVNLRDCRRCFHFRAIFHIANVMPPADPCSISRLAVQFRWFWRLKLVSHFTLLQAICKMFVLDKDHHSVIICLKCFCLTTM